MELLPPGRPSWKRRLGIGLLDILTLVITIPACYLVFIMGVFTSDSASGNGYAITYLIIAFAGIYALATLALVVLSQVKNSWKLAVLPIILPLLFFVWIAFI